MKKIITLFAALLVVASVQAQTPNFGKGDNVATVGVGIGSTNFNIPISLSFEHGVYDINAKSAIGVGGKLAYGGSSAILAVTGSYHYDLFGGNWDPYAELALGYSLGSYSVFHSGISIGTRYFFTDSIAAFAKVGYGLSWLEVGASYKF